MLHSDLVVVKGSATLYDIAYGKGSSSEAGRREFVVHEQADTKGGIFA
ncbi:MAG: hypothetical protein HYV24_06815 [Deltaproteobacteria bacterium]|nr:hypothetical protein [Deltaproteobacteria bacterium]